MQETPKKLIETHRCFTCSLETLNRVYVFGKSSIDFVKIIRSSLGVDLNSFSAQPGLFICKPFCYKKLTKFQRASDHLEEVRQEIECSFRNREQPRIKRQILEEVDNCHKNPCTTNRDETKAGSNRAAKSLKFSNISAVSPIREHESPMTSVCIRNETLNNETASKCLTSTPFLEGNIPQPQDLSDSITVNLSVRYPSKTLNKKLCKNLKAIGKALANGISSQIANAVMNCPTVKEHIVKKTLFLLNKEVTGLCSKQNPSMLSKTSKKDLKKFNIELLCKEWREKAPLFYSFLMAVSTNKRTKGALWFGSVAMAGSILLKQKNEKMNAMATVIGIAMKCKLVESTISRLNKLRVTSSNSNILAKLDALGIDHNANLIKSRDQITNDNKLLDTAKQNCSKLSTIPGKSSELSRALQERMELRKAVHPGFVISFDNIDIHVDRKNMTLQSQNRDFHWLNHQYIENRVSGAFLNANGPQNNVKDIPVLQFLPSVCDQQKQRHNYITLTSRILVEYFDVFEPFAEVCVKHIPHKYAKEMSQKTRKVPLGIIFKNENENQDMHLILKQFHSYLPKRADGKIDSQIFSGDQLSVERAVNVIASVANGLTEQDRLDGMNLQIGDWHAAVKLLSMIFERFFSGKSSDDACTMFADRSVINRRNVTSDASSSYRPNRDFLMIVFKSRVIAAAMSVLGMESKESLPTKLTLPEDLRKLPKSEKLKYLHELSEKVVDAFVFKSSSSINSVISSVLTQEENAALQQQNLTPDGRFPCRFPGCHTSFKYNGKSRMKHEASHSPPVTVEEPNVSISPCKPSSLQEEVQPLDDVYNYNCALLADSYLFFNFLDAIKEGDGARIMRQYKYFMLFCKADGNHSTKYALECLYQFLLIYGVLSRRDSERFIWNRSVNNHGKKGCNIPLDEATEHSNNFLKQCIKNLGPNISEPAVARIGKSESVTRSILDNLDESITQHLKSGNHSSPSSSKDLDELVKKALEFNIFQEQRGREYRHFRHFQKDRLNNLDVRDLYSWISKHKKNIAQGVKAR